MNKNGKQEPIRFLVFSVSMRHDSLNTRLAKLAAEAIEKNGGTVDFANMSEFDCPSFNQDLETASSQPKGAAEFRPGNSAHRSPEPVPSSSLPSRGRTASRERRVQRARQTALFEIGASPGTQTRERQAQGKRHRSTRAAFAILPG